MAVYLIGIDIGTQGARVVLMDAKGAIVCAHEEVFALSEQSLEEQSPSVWWEACLLLLKSLSQIGRAHV